MTKTTNHIERFLRWYPPAWRARYGDELAALSEDVHGEGGLPRGERLSLVRSGLEERAHAVGLRGASGPPAQRVRSASLLVLCGWAAFMVAGSVFAKFSEHWIGPTPPSHRAVPSTGYTVVQWAGTIGGLVVLASLVLALPAFFRHLRGGGWSTVRLPIVRVAVAGLAMVALTTALALWAHQLSGADRNGGSGAYEVAFVLWAMWCVAAFAVITWSGVVVAAQLPFTARTDRVFGLLAAVVTIDMAAVVGGLLVWWVSLAQQAPRALHRGLLATGSVAPPALVGSGLLMVGAFTAAVCASSRALASLRSVGTETP